MLQMRRPYKALNPDVCLFIKSGETINHLFLHCPLTFKLWYKLLKLAQLDRFLLGVYVT